MALFTTLTAALVTMGMTMTAATIATGVIVGVVVGAVIGGITAAITGGNILKGMLMGGLVGGITGGVAAGVGAAGGAVGGSGGGVSGGAAGGVATAGSTLTDLGVSGMAVVPESTLASTTAASEAGLAGGTAATVGPTVAAASELPVAGGGLMTTEQMLTMEGLNAVGGAVKALFAGSQAQDASKMEEEIAQRARATTPISSKAVTGTFSKDSVSNSTNAPKVNQASTLPSIAPQPMDYRNIDPLTGGPQQTDPTLAQSAATLTPTVPNSVSTVTNKNTGAINA